ncbi:signal peptidase I [Enterococcus sp. BWT-B8]|uniref:signal peptidase I n=1 Tax=unclassified Enterococcus TaxID=2608891 RepID=UPI001E469FAA|nr:MULTISPECIES: signal peptidase I [unclassified Enterococcus]MCB5952513.1 signal peptidase I [Enterococcus sp. BWT-B8]MCB5953446.1 signal peptidase I [Enterococcus sp. CWB-B31]
MSVTQSAVSSKKRIQKKSRTRQAMAQPISPRQQHTPRSKKKKPTVGGSVQTPKKMRVKVKKVPKMVASAPQTVGQRVSRYRDTLIILSLAVLLGLFFFRFGTHRVDGRSMAPTFQTNNRILFNKHQLPVRYAIVTFIPADAPDDSYVKRVIGLPGDPLLVDGTALYLLPKETGQELPVIEELSSLPDGTIKLTVSEGVAQSLTNLTEIPPDQYFVLGDNRNHSTDSRAFGLIRQDQIEGVVVSRYYPIGGLEGQINERK